MPLLSVTRALICYKIQQTLGPATALLNRLLEPSESPMRDYAGFSHHKGTGSGRIRAWGCFERINCHHHSTPLSLLPASNLISLSRLVISSVVMCGCFPWCYFGTCALFLSLFGAKGQFSACCYSVCENTSFCQNSPRRKVFLGELNVVWFSHLNPMILNKGQNKNAIVVSGKGILLTWILIMESGETTDRPPQGGDPCSTCWYIVRWGFVTEANQCK